MATYQTDPTKWQASSHPALNELDPEDLFEPAFVDQFKMLHADLWRRVTRAHEIILTLEELHTFPFDLLYAPTEMVFWRLVHGTFYDSVGLILHGLVNDEGTDVHSLRSFKTLVVQAPWLDPAKRQLLVETIRARKFDKDLASIAKNVERIRHSAVAHRLYDATVGSFKNVDAEVTLSELRRLFEATQAQFGALSFGASYSTVSGDLFPSTVGGARRPTCLGTVLDAVIRNHAWVNEPETTGATWPAIRQFMTLEQLTTLNELRQRVGLSMA